jgi:ATP-dependent RNA helicase DDX56/DBP9
MATKEDMHVEPSFEDFGLDGRLLKAISKLGWSKPTLIQGETIPLALEGKDILARARTGSGKTGAYAIPIIQKLLESRLSMEEAQGTKALILAPSKELCQQTMHNFKDLSAFCTKDIRVVDVASVGNLSSQRSALAEKPDVVIATPGKALGHLQSKTFSVKDTLEMLVIDEADLTFSYGFEEDLKKLVPFLPQICQSFLMSATLSEDVKTLKKLMLHNPVTLKLEEGDLPPLDQLTQYHIRCEKDDKYLLIFAMLKLNLVQGKTLIFVNDINSCYKLKLFLEQFGIRSCVLNSELPYNSRQHIVDEFNRGVYEYMIATDEAHMADMKQHGAQTRKQKSKHRKDQGYGVSRGIDFQGVENVLNFDFPPSPDAYIHRVGRTARGTETGSSLSFVCDSEVTQLKEVEAKLTGGAVNETPIAVKPYKFKMSEIDGFRYRVKVSTLSVLSFSKVHGIYTISIMYGIYTISIMYSIYTINIMYNIYIPVCTVLFYLLCVYFSFQI